MIIITSLHESSLNKAYHMIYNHIDREGFISN
jgi:hypothetical protein